MPRKNKPRIVLELNVSELLDEMTAGQLCDFIDEAITQLRARNEEARNAGAAELWPATTTVKA